MGLGSQIAGLLTATAVFAATLWVYQHRIFTIPLNAIWAWVAIFFLEDFTYYWFHRLSHERRFWWAAHVNHHSSQHYNLSTALASDLDGRGNRHLGAVAAAGVSRLPACDDRGGEERQPDLPVLDPYGDGEEVPEAHRGGVQHPSHHRVHHARNPRYLDRNYAGILIIWDRMFGTFVEETDEEAPRYGIVKNLGDFNLLRAAFHEWEAIGRDLLTARSPREVWGYLFGPPGWSPDGSRQTSDVIRAGMGGASSACGSALARRRQAKARRRPARG